MSQFYGTLEGQGRTRATRRGGKQSGITTHAASWAGAIRVRVWDDNGAERFEVCMVPWQGRGSSVVLASGIVGQEPRT